MLDSNSNIHSIASHINLLDQYIANSVNSLASGKKIISAENSAATIAFGNKLRSDVSAINVAITNTAQAKSMTGVAHGAIDQISLILSNLQSLATESASGAVSDVERTNLNVEFGLLVEEIDRIATTTNFNGIKLVDGSLADASIVKTDTANTATAAQGNLQVVNSLTNGETITISVDGENVSFLANNSGTFTDPLLEIDLLTHTTATTQATAIANQITQIKDYSGADTDVLNAKRILSKLNVNDFGSGIVNISAVSAGTRFNAVNFTSSAAAGDVTLDGQNIDGVGSTLGTSGAVAIDGALSAGTFSSGVTAFAGTATTVVTGVVGDSILENINTTSQATTGIDVSAISNNAAFIDKISGFSVTYTGANTVNINLTVGGDTFAANSVNTNFTNDTTVTFASQNANSGGFFTLRFNGGAGENVTNQTEANVYAARLDAAFSTVSFNQIRDITNYTASGQVFPAGSIIPSGDLSGSSFKLINSNFNTIKIEDVNVTASASSEAVIEFTINGQIFRSGYDANGSPLAIGNTITDTEGGNETIGFVNIANPNEILIFDYESAVTLNITSDAEAQGLEKAFKNAFGIGVSTNNNKGASFQVGTSASDIINLRISSVKSQDLFIDNNNVSKTLNISTTGGAETAKTVISNAIANLGLVRAQVGSYESRFDYAQANLETSKINIDSARAVYQDTNIAEETANLAKLTLQAEIASSVLSQSIRVQKSLLKLLD